VNRKPSGDGGSRTRTALRPPVPETGVTTIPPRPRDATEKTIRKMSQGRANERFADKLALAYFEAKKNPDVEVSLLVDTADEVALAFSILLDILMMLGVLDMKKTHLGNRPAPRKPPGLLIELKNGSAIRIAIKPELSL
jgi:hypothetical protein